MDEPSKEWTADSHMLPQDVLQRRTALSAKPTPVVLSGKHVRLRPLELETDLNELFAHSNGNAITLGARHVNAYDPDALIWRYMSGGPFAQAEELRSFLLPQLSALNALPLSVVDIASGKPVGVCNYMNNYPEHLKIELGNIWYSPIVQRTAANLEATYLMLQHAFELGYRRVEWKCDALNERSRRAALRMGFKFEGIQEQHFIIKGRNRDTAWFRILDSEWNDVKILLEQMLQATV